ncbi:MAG TPA: FGGY family carbohydrate kinase [Actinomycetota bacterium]|nr:FGGY family carbohydrate kinase [Actinomycetota bacterium]
MDLVAGVDVATAAVRAAAANSSGVVVAEASLPLPQPQSPQPGHSEQDASAWAPAVFGTLRELSGQLGERAGNVVALSVSATSGTVAALDSHGAFLGPALTYADQRAGAEAAVAQAAAAQTWAALGLTIAPSFGLPKWGWMVRRWGAGRIARLVHVPDVVVEALTGRPGPSDTSHALKSGYDPVARRWVGEALEALDIPLRLLPEVRLPGEPAGRLTPAASRSTGLPAGCEIRLGMTDSCSSQLAAGAAEPGQFVSVLGSTLVLKGASLRPVADPGGAVYSHLHPGGWWLPGGASSAGARALQEAFPGRNLAELDRLAAEAGPAGAVTYPLVGRGERFPFAAPGAQGFTLGRPANEVERYRAILEGVAFVERLGYERLRELGARPEGRIVASGRASASREWNTIRATVLGLPLVAKPEASTALGACILAAAGALHPDLASATAAMCAGGEPISPNDGERQALDRSYRRFVEELQSRGWTGHPR